MEFRATVHYCHEYTTSLLIWEPEHLLWKTIANTSPYMFIKLSSYEKRYWYSYFYLKLKSLVRIWRNHKSKTHSLFRRINRVWEWVNIWLQQEDKNQNFNTFICFYQALGKIIPFGSYIKTHSNVLPFSLAVNKKKEVKTRLLAKPYIII